MRRGIIPFLIPCASNYRPACSNCYAFQAFAPIAEESEACDALGAECEMPTVIEVPGSPE